MAVVLGNSTQESQNAGGNNKPSFRFQASASITVYRIISYVLNSAANVAAAIYNDSAGVPGTLLVGSGSQAYNGTPGWQTFSITGTPLTNGNYYHLCTWASSAMCGIAYRSSASTLYSSNNGTFPTWPASFVEDGSLGGGPISCYCDDWSPAVTYTKTFTVNGVVLVTFNKLITSDGRIIRNDTNFTKESKYTLPTNYDNLATTFTDTNYNDVLTSNDVRVSEGANSSGSSPIFLFKKKNANNTDTIAISWEGQVSIAASIAPVYLQIFNLNSGLWETIGSNNSAGAGTDFTISGTQSTSLSNYYDANNWVIVRVYQDLRII
jgi:hypothetical protein